jgi:hypothetical protein
MLPAAHRQIAKAVRARRSVQALAQELEPCGIRKMVL